MKTKNRKEIDMKYKWDLERLYSDAGQWDKELNSTKSNLEKLGEYSGKLEDGTVLLEFLYEREKISRVIDKLKIYAYLRCDENTELDEGQMLKSRIDDCSASLSETISFFEPEILNLGYEKLWKLMDSDDNLKVYATYFKRLFERKEHILNSHQEKIMGTLDDFFYSGESMFYMIAEDIVYPNIKDSNGEEFELTDNNCEDLAISEDRTLRQNCFNAMNDTYSKHENASGCALSTSLESCSVQAKIRNYSSSLESKLKPNNIPEDVYTNAIETINANLSSLHRYLELKKRVLGLEEMHMYDIDAPIVLEREIDFSFEDGVSLLEKALLPLGEEYMKLFKEGIESRWIDLFENEGKSGGAYASGCYDSTPYVLMNYYGSHRDVSTLAHEMGHAIHKYLSCKNQPYIYSEGNFCNEIVALTNECLFLDSLTKEDMSKDEKMFLVNEELEKIVTTVFRQLMFAEFELTLHQQMDEGEYLSGGDISEIYYDLNKKYYGDAVVVDEAVAYEWAGIPHFYEDFYVYEYAVGYSAARAICNMLHTEGDSAKDRYMNLLKSGNCEDPVDLLKKAGVDITSSKPLEDTMERFNDLLDQFESLVF